MSAALVNQATLNSAVSTNAQPNPPASGVVPGVIKRKLHTVDLNPSLSLAQFLSSPTILEANHQLESEVVDLTAFCAQASTRHSAIESVIAELDVLIEDAKK